MNTSFFRLKIKGKDKEVQNLPVTIKNTKQIYNYSQSSLNSGDKKSIIYFNECYLSQEHNYDLLDIGYSPKDILQIELAGSKKAFFNISSVNYQYCIPISKFSTIFTMKEYFAEQFFTVPQNISIILHKEVLSDERLLFNIETTADSPFEVTVKEDYLLVRVYFNEFRLVCIQKDSTIENLKDTISVYTQKDDSLKLKLKYIDKQAEQPNDQQQFSDIYEKVPLFEFKIDESQSKRFLIQIEVSIFEEEEKTPKIKRVYKSFNATNVYSVMCLLERDLRIERNLFIAFGQNGQNIEARSAVLKNQNKNLSFRIFKPVNAIIDGQLMKFSHLTTIKDLQVFNEFERHNFGIVINNHFAFHDEGSKFLLIHFMNNSDDLKDLTKIYIKKSKTPCHSMTFIKLNENEKAVNKRHFIVPVGMKKEEISKFYLHENYTSIKGREIKPNVITYKDADAREISYVFTDEKNKVLKIIVHGTNPRVLDLIQQIFKEKKKISQKFKEFFENKNFGAAGVLFKGERLPFYEPLSNIFDDEKNRIEIQGYKVQKSINVFVLVDNMCSYVPYDHYDKNTTASKIIETIAGNLKLDKRELKLYVDFNELNPNDTPSIFKQDKDFIILNKVTDKKKFKITNGTVLTVNYEISKDCFEFLSSIISGMFCLQEDKIKFKVNIEGGDYDLPSKFNAGSLPDGAEIQIEYAYEKIPKMSFRYEEIKSFDIPNIDNPIESFIPMVQKELKIVNVSKTALELKFCDFKIPIGKSFSDFQVPSNSIIPINKKASSFPIKIFTIESSNMSYEFIFNIDDKIKDVKDHFMSLFNSNVEFSLEKDGRTILDDNTALTKDMTLFMISKKVRIICEGSLENKVIEVSEILTVLNAAEYLKKKLKYKFISIYVKNKEDNSYSNVDINKRLYEIEDHLYGHKFVPKIEFTNYVIFNSARQYFSALNTIGLLKENFISKAMLTDPKKIRLMNADKNTEINDGQTIEDVILKNKERLKIEFKSDQKMPISAPLKKKKFTPIILKIPKEDDNNNDDIKIDDDNNKDTNANDNVINNIDNNDIVQIEEEEDVEELNVDEIKNDGASFTYSFLINKDPVCKMAFKEDATINDAKIRIAKEQGDIDPNCVSILFAGKVLRKDIPLQNLNLNETDILQVYIRNMEDIFLRTARALRVYGQADIEEYYSEYEDDEK